MLKFIEKYSKNNIKRKFVLLNENICHPDCDYLKSINECHLFNEKILKIKSFRLYKNGKMELDNDNFANESFWFLQLCVRCNECLGIE